jgi:hypothetical protein
VESTGTTEEWHNDEIHDCGSIAMSKYPNSRQSGTWTMHEIMCVAYGEKLTKYQTSGRWSITTGSKVSLMLFAFSLKPPSNLRPRMLSTCDKYSLISSSHSG